MATYRIPNPKDSVRFAGTVRGCALARGLSLQEGTGEFDSRHLHFRDAGMGLGVRLRPWYGRETSSTLVAGSVRSFLVRRNFLARLVSTAAWLASNQQVTARFRQRAPRQLAVEVLRQHVSLPTRERGFNSRRLHQPDAQHRVRRSLQTIDGSDHPRRASPRSRFSCPAFSATGRRILPWVASTRRE